MSLIVKPPSWRYCTSNLTGTPALLNPGANDTAGVGSKGSTVSVLTAIPHDVELLMISQGGRGVSASNTSALLDVMVDPAGGTSWAATPLIPDLLAGSTQAASSAPPSRWFSFPLWVKSGSSLGVRTQSVVATSGRTVILAFGGNRNPGSWWCGQRVTAYGIDSANSRGTMHTPGNSGAYSSWTNLGSTVSSPGGAVQFMVQGAATTTANAMDYHFELGIGGDAIGPPIFHETFTNETAWQTPTGPVFREIPSGAQLQIRATARVTAQAQDVAAYVVH